MNRSRVACSTESSEIRGGAGEAQAGSVFQIGEGDGVGAERVAGGWLVWDDRCVDGLGISLNDEDDFVKVSGDCDFAFAYQFDLWWVEDCARNDVDRIRIRGEFANLVFQLTPDSCVH